MVPRAKLEVLGGLLPSSAIHGQHRQLGVAEDEGVDVAELGGRRRGLGEETGRLVGVREEQLGFGRQGESHRTPRAPRRLLGRGRGRVRGHLLRAGATQQRFQHGPGGLERRGAVHRREVEGGSVNDGRPPLGLGGAPGQRSEPPGERSKRGMVLDRRTAEGSQPPLHGQQLAGLEGRQQELSSQRDAPLPLGRVHQVLEGQRQGSVGLVPVRGSQVQGVDDLGLDPTELTEQELAEESVIAVPATTSVERDEEEAGRLQPGELGLGTGLPENRVAQRRTELIDDRRATQELLRGLG